MPDHNAIDTRAGRPLDSPPRNPSLPPRNKLTSGLGYFVLFVATVAFLSVNNTYLRAMAKDVAAEQQAAKDATKPAEIETITLINSDCPACYNVTNLINNIGANQKVKATNPRTVDINSTAGAALIKQYQLTRSPAFVVQGQIEKLLAAVPGLKTLGQAQNDVFVGSKIPAPYTDLATGKLRGAFTATYITEKSCLECYDPTINRQAMARFGMTAASEKTVDRADAAGRQLIKQYAITSTPTIILTGDLSAYDGFDQAWSQVGTIEADGAYVFRTGQSYMGTYYDLTAKKTVGPPPSGSAGSGATGGTNSNPAQP